ncbi:MAG: XdhC family protein [Desulfovibrio sp.]|jgi:xanthine dehydrogenase accessory factor|nr:XdhC family protein [Desulfovibrio sp.]
MKQFCHTVMEHLERGTPLVLVTVMESSGSVPRSAGARMLVLPDGRIDGTVGGGRYEAEAIAVALELHKLGRALDEAGGPVGTASRVGAVIDYTLSGVTDIDMVCGGSLSLLLEHLPDAPLARAVFAAGREAERAGQPFTLVGCFRHDTEATPLEGGHGEVRCQAGKLRRARVERFIVLPESLSLMPPGARLPAELLDRAGVCADDQPQLLAHEGFEYLLEPFPRPFRLFIFGCGHVSRELADLAFSVDFHVTVTDDRPEFASPARFPTASVELAPSLGERDCAALLARFDPGPSDGVVILTRGHTHDRDALAASLGFPLLGYLGMIGSERKRALVYANLEKQGVPASRLAAVSSPVGFDISARTLREIAISIVAELIAWRASARNGKDYTKESGAAAKKFSGTGA